MLRLPMKMDREIAVLDAYLGAAGPAHVFLGQLHNLPAFVGELMVLGEVDPGLFRLKLPFTLGKGRMTDPAQVQAVRARADELWAEYRGLARAYPDLAAKTREGYLRVIDGRLPGNPRVAVRVFRSDVEGGDSAAFSDRFTLEDQSLRALNHRNILRRYAGIVDSKLGPCLFMEHVGGKSLDRICRRRQEKGMPPLPLATVAHVAFQLARALDHAHSHGVIHGDLRPSNVVIEEPSETRAAGKAEGIIKIANFGGASEEGIPFMAPEQLRDGIATPAADVYQLGSSLFFIATGRVPYEGGTLDEIREGILSPGPHRTRVHHLREDIAPRFEALIEGARDKDPGKRWPLKKVLEEITHVYASRIFSLKDGVKSGIAEELLQRVMTNAALKDYYRALEALETASGFLDGLPPDKEPEVCRAFSQLSEQLEPHRADVAAVRKVYLEHIGPVDHLMEELYRRYGKDEPLLREGEKGIMKETGADTVVVRRSLIEKILGHTSAAIAQLAKIDAEHVGEMHHKMVDRASSQEEACSDLATRTLKFGDDYIRKDAPGE